MSHSPNPELLAADLERLAKTLRADGRAAVARAWDWSGHLRGSGGEPMRGSGTSDPTGTAATNRPEASAALYADLSAAMKLMAAGIDTLTALIDKCQPQRTERIEAIGLDSLNGRSGTCQVCSDPHVFTGTRDDRLRTLTSGERVDGELVSPKVCEPCYRSWQRRPYAEDRRGFICFDEWLTGRVEHLTAERGKVT